MVIERSFEVVTVVPPEDVLEILSDLELSIPMWSIYESMELISDNEAYVTLRISGSTYRLRLRLRRERNRIVIEGTGPIALTIVINVERRGAGTIISGKVTVKAGFFRERILAPGIAAFIDDTKNKVMFQLPMIAEVYRERKKGMEKPPVREEKPREKVEEVKKPEVKELAPQPEQPPQLAEHEVKPQPKEIRKHEEAPKKVEEREEVPALKPAKVPSRINIRANPDKLGDELVLGMILLRSELIDTIKVSLSGEEVLNQVSRKYSDLKEDVLYINIRSSDGKINMKFLIEKEVLTGVRVDLQDRVLNGREALEHIMSLPKVEGRMYIFKVPPGVV